MKLVTASAEYRNGRLIILARTQFDVSCAKKFTEGACQIQVRQRGKDISHPQRGYLWAVVYPYLAEFFVDVEVQEVHEEMKKQFNPIEVTLPDGRLRIFGGSTEQFDAGEYSKYTDKIRNWAALPITEGGLSLYIPEPKEG